MLKIFFFIACIASFAAMPSPKERQLVILGDSLTEGYGVAQGSAFPQLIQKKLQDEKLSWKIISSGSSGSTSASTLQRLKWVSKSHPDYVLILMGSNDGLRGLKIKETEKNLSDAIEWAQKNKINIIIGQLHAPPNYGKDYFRQFSQIFPHLAKKYKIKLAPFLLEKVVGQSSLNLADGIHPNEKGHALIAETIYGFLKKEVF